MLRVAIRRSLALVSALLPLAGLIQDARAVDRTYSSCPDPCLTGQPSCPAVPITDFSTAELSIPVPNDAQGNFITDVNVTFLLTHTYQGDLRVELVSPSGTSVRLINRPGGGGFSADDLGRLTFVIPDGCAGLFSMYFDDDPAAVYNDHPYDSPFVPSPGYPQGVNPADSLLGGSYLPVDALAAFNGENKVGTWRLRVSDNAGGDSGLLRFFRLNIRSAPLSQPTAFIASPTDFACGCSPLQVIGTVQDTQVGIAAWLLEWAASANGPWSPVSMGNGPVSNGPLSNWTTFPAGEGLRFFRLTATNALGLTSSFTTVAYLDQSFEVLSVEQPPNSVTSYWSQTACVFGSVNDYCFSQYTVRYAEPPFSSYNLINGGAGVFPTGVTNDEIALWDVSTLPDGPYKLRVEGSTTCGRVRSIQRDVIVDNTPPVVLISNPANCARGLGVVAITGTASDANLSGWLLQVTGGPYHGWVTIGSGASNMNNGLLANWNTSGLPDCAYTLRLIVTDRAAIGCRPDSQSTEYLTSFNVAQSQCDDIDFNNDGSFFDPCDIDSFLVVFSEGPCTSCGL